MNRNSAIAGAVGVAALGGAGLFAYSRWKAGAQPPPAPDAPQPSESNPPQGTEPSTPASPSTDVPGADEVGLWESVKPLPTMADVAGDYTSNWGSTPAIYRPLYLLMEKASQIPGSARVYSVISFGEARYNPTAHNGGGTTSRDEFERVQSRRAWNSMQTRGYNEDNTPFGPTAAEFGSGGKFGALAPYFLATGAVSLGKANAPLLKSDPRIIFVPRVAAFCAVVYLWRLLVNPNYLVEDIPAIKVGWASPSFLTASNRGGESYTRVHEKFQRHATEVGIDLSKLPARLDPGSFPGVMPVFEQLVGTLPTLRGAS